MSVVSYYHSIILYFLFNNNSHYWMSAMKKIISKVLKIAKKFPKPLTKEERFIQLVEEVGELANLYEVDLEKETEAMLKRLDKRIKDQEFEF